MYLYILSTAITMFIIIDNGSKFIKNLETRLTEANITFKVFNHSEQIDFDTLPIVKGVILSGGPGDPFGPENITTDFEIIMNLKCPIIGFCLGHEILAVAFAGMVDNCPGYQNKLQEVIIDKKDDPIFEGIANHIYLREKHHRHVTKLPHNFRILGHSTICPIEIMRHNERIIYGFQSHPEASGETGMTIMQNFFKICDSL